MNLANFKRRNSGASTYVESTATVHNLLFYVHTLSLKNINYSSVPFLLDSQLLIQNSKPIVVCARSGLTKVTKT